MKNITSLLLMGLLIPFYLVSCSDVESGDVEVQTSSIKAGSCSDQISYLSATDPAYRYLEAEQKSIYSGFPDLVDPILRTALSDSSSQRDLDELIEDIRKQGLSSPAVEMALRQYLYCEPLPTRYESPLLRFGLDLFVEKLVGASELLKQPPKFGSLPTGQVNGQALLPPGSDIPLIIIERDVFSFTGAFSKSIVDAVPIESSAQFVSLSHDREEILLRLEQEPEIVQNFADAMIRMVREGSPRGANERFLGPNHNLLHARLVSGMDQFIIAHEIAHVELNHTSESRRRFNFLGEGNWENQEATQVQALTFLERSKMQELEADAQGMRLLIQANHPTLDEEQDLVGVLVQAAAAETVFSIYETIELYRRQAGIAGLGSRSHPTAAERKAVVRDVLEEIRITNDFFSMNADFREIFEASFSTLLERADPVIRAELDLPPDSEFETVDQVLKVSSSQ